MNGLSWWLRWWGVCLQCGRPGFDPWVGKIPSRSKWQPNPVLLPGEFHGWRSLEGYSPWDHRENVLLQLVSLEVRFQMELRLLISCLSNGALRRVSHGPGVVTGVLVSRRRSWKSENHRDNGVTFLPNIHCWLWGWRTRAGSQGT